MDWIKRNARRMLFIELGLILCFESMTLIENRLARWVAFTIGVLTVIFSKKLQEEVSE